MDSARLSCNLILTSTRMNTDKLQSSITVDDNQLKDFFADFDCPYCGSALSFSKERIGTAQECPHCYESVVVPLPGLGINARLPVPIDAPRLIIRPLTREDLPDLLEYITDDNSYKYLHLFAPDDLQVRRWFEEGNLYRFTRPKGWLPLGIELKTSRKVIGHLFFYLVDEDHLQGTFNVMIHPDYRRHGYAMEALTGLFGFGFIGIGLHDIRLRVDIRNVPGCRLMEAAGMKLEGEYVEEYRFNGEWVSSVCYGILSSRWLANRKGGGS